MCIQHQNGFSTLTFPWELGNISAMNFWMLTKDYRTSSIKRKLASWGKKTFPIFWSNSSTLTPSLVTGRSVWNRRNSRCCFLSFPLPPEAAQFPPTPHSLIPQQNWRALVWTRSAGILPPLCSPPITHFSQNWARGHLSQECSCLHLFFFLKLKTVGNNQR